MKRIILGLLVWGGLGAALATFGLPFTTLGFWVVTTAVIAIVIYEKCIR